jgi:beta-glucosidase
VLFGKYNPSGRLPITYPKYNHHLSTYDYKWIEISVGNNIDVEFEFGHGLSYTTFAYSNLSLSPTPSLPWNDQLSITLEVRNTGSILGDHTVLLFTTDVYRSITPPNKELKGYYKLTLMPGEQRKVEFQLNRTDLSFIGLDNTRQTEPGLFTVIIGDLRASFTLLAVDKN